MSRWRYAWGELRGLFDAAWERQKELDSWATFPRWERFWSYVAWPFAAVLLTLFLLPLIAFAWENDDA